MTINAPASLLLLLYELVAEGQGVAPEALRGTVQNDILKEYIARGNYIFPPRPSMRLTTDLFAYCAERIPALEHDLDLRLPHPRGGLDRGAGDRLHARERPRLLRGGGRRGPVAGRVRRAPVVLLQRAQRLLPGGGEVPGGAAALGEAARGAASASRTRARSRCASTRRPAARRSRRSSRRTTSSGSRSRRSPPSAAARSRCTRTASTRRSRCRRSARPRSRSARSRCSQHEIGVVNTADPFGGSYYVEALTDELEARALELIERIDELGGAVGGDRGGLGAGRDRGRGVPLPAGGRVAASG